MALKDNVAEFTAAIQHWAKTVAPEKVLLFQRAIALEMLRRVVIKTPVDTGRARGNWQVTIGEPAAGHLENLFDKTGSTTIAKGSAVIAKIPPFAIVYITNNVPYILILEAGRVPGPPARGSKQAEHGMAGITFQEALAVFAPKTKGV